MADPAPARILADPATLRRRVAELAAELATEQAGSVPVVVPVLRGGVVFAADLVRSMPGPVVVDFLGLSSYTPGTDRARITRDLDVDVSGRSVVVVEDIVDTGLTLSFVLAHLRQRSPAAISVCALFDKQAHRLVPVAPDHAGFTVVDEFVIGYGLDYQGRYRNLPLAAAGDVSVLAADPDAYVAQLYGRR